jgi:peptide/nickel transport system permease protein
MIPGLSRRPVSLAATGWVGLAVCVPVILVALVGPYFAPHNPAAFLGSPFSPPSHRFPLGTDYLGRDALSRFLWGGRTALLLALLGTLLAHALGIPAGIFAAYSRGVVEGIFNRITESILAIPGIILILLLISGFGISLAVVVVGMGVAGAPRVARLVRGAALQVRYLAFVEVAESRGESRSYVVAREIFPNILPTIGVDFGIRLATSIVVVASVSFLGLGLQPPASDWGLIIAENRAGLTLQPWAALTPAIAIGMLAVGINLAIDGMRRHRRVSIASQLDVEAVQ